MWGENPQSIPPGFDTVVKEGPGEGGRDKRNPSAGEGGAPTGGEKFTILQ